MRDTCTRRHFAQTLLAGAVGLGVRSALAQTAADNAFSFLLLGDLHFDKLVHHDLAWLGRDKPEDLRQVREYSRITAEMLPRLFATLRETMAEVQGKPGAPSSALANEIAELAGEGVGARGRVVFVAQAGDLVEGLCGSKKLALEQDIEVIEVLRQADLGAPFLFTKGNHDITGEGAAEAFKEVFHPFLGQQATTVDPASKFTSACYALEHRGALFCFLDAYDKAGLDWLEATLAKRTAAHCFVLVHPPVVPVGARSTWVLFSGERQQAQRERLLTLLGRNHAFVLTGHLHKYCLAVRTTSGGGRFLQLGLSSVIPAPEVQPKQVLSGVTQYTPDQLKVEPTFSPATEKERRAVYETEAPHVKQFEYADLPGYALFHVNGPQVTARIYAGVSRQLWRSLDLSQLLQS